MIQFILYLINLYFIRIVFSKYKIPRILINIYFLDFFIYIGFNPLFSICKLILDNNYIMLFFFLILLFGIVKKIGNVMGFILDNFIYTVMSVVDINNNKIIIVRFIITATIAVIVVIFFL